jgi:hypothetical protein
MTEQEIDRRWPVLAQVVRAIEWHSDADVEWFCKSFAIEAEHASDQLDAAEAELAVMPGRRIVEVIQLDPGETCDDAPNACTVLTRYFN